MEGPTQDSVLRPAGYAVVEAMDTTFYKNRYEMIMLCNYDAKEWNKKWVTEQIDVGVQLDIPLRYPFADLLDKKDKKGADNTLEKGQLIQVDEDISRDAMVTEKLLI
jgi:hypothetical protein